MAGYPVGDNEARVAESDLLGACTDIFRACGMGEADAGLLADTLVFADVRGVHSHGVLRVAEYVDKLIARGVDPRARPRVTSDRGAALVVDAGNAMGQIGCAFAAEQAIARARTTHVAVAAIGGSNHCGALSYFSEMAREAGMIGIAASNALPTMAPFGGLDKILGISPLAISIPSGQEPPIVFDAAFSASSHGKIRVFAQKGAKIPLDWAFDRDGHPTDDPQAAIQGLLQPIGGYKGTGLAIVWGILSTLLAGASFGTDLGNMVDGPTAGRDGQILIAIDVAGFTDLQTFTGGVDRIVRQIRDSRPAPGATRCFSPGEVEAVTQAAYRREGIPLNAETLDTIHRAAGLVGVTVGDRLPTRDAA